MFLTLFMTKIACTDNLSHKTLARRMKEYKIK